MALARYNTQEDLDPHVRLFLCLSALIPKIECLPISLARRLFHWTFCLSSPKIPFDGRIYEENISSHSNLLKVRIWEHRNLKPEAPGLLYIHGGGFVLGSPSTHHQFCSLIAQKGLCKVYSVDYRKSPENPFPAALSDIRVAWEWLSNLRENARGQYHQLHQQGLYVAGDSAGGNLATVLCHQLRDLGKPLPQAQFLIFPLVHMGEDWESFRRFGHGFLLTTKLLHWLTEQYLGLNDRESPLISPLLAKNFRDLPKTFIALAGCDMLLDQGLAYARALENSGNDVLLKVYPNMIHSFINFLRIPSAFRAAQDVVLGIEQLMKDHDQQKMEA